ncbi:hypothetical protein F8154_09390 [Alkaliphilus pronyensis]|uniref:Uncharacterized protein n=1 Tax=Alkaliphilus pronyensis TaxID=1482732 RepID=A0A6I0EXZ1_9FIRM|nr:hypothetical protein [Alkaliphilus pronyensis]KAB3534141.1 hypothetical protein F8154_09390 [Alkaliphilus pronyensis]
MEKFEDLLTSDELKLYKSILKEVDKNKTFYSKALPESKLKELLKTCGATEKDLYNIMKKLVQYNEAGKEGDVCRHEETK